MQPTAACPELTQYKKLASGQLSASEQEAVLEHLEKCQACVQRVESLSEKDTLVDLIRQAQTLSEGAASETVARLVERLQKLRLSAEAAPESLNLAPTGAARDRRTAVTQSYQGAEPSEPASKALYDFLAPAQLPDELGRLGPYRVLKVLGAGGMGIVFRAEDPKLARMVALKAMLPEYLANDSARQRFLREARAAAAIKHDHIVSIYQVGEDRGVLFLAMELLEGESLDARLQREGKLPAAEVVRIGRQIDQALAAAHKRGLIHRDIKPANIWIEAESGRVKILDFGLARGTTDIAHITQQGMIVGTPAYMAPEQGQGKDVDHRCDLFSLGCVLYRMATGAAPFRGADMISTLIAVATETPRPPRVLEPSLPRALSDLIVSLLAKEADDRPASAQVVEKLDRIAQELSRPAPAKPRRRWPAIAAAAAVLGLLAAGVVFFMQTGDGTVRIEIDDPEIKLAIEGHAATITNADKQPITLKPGKHGLTITRGDFTFDTASFELPRRGKTVLKITWLPGQKMVVMQDGTAVGEKAAPLAAKTLLPTGLTDEEWLQRVKGLDFRKVPDAVAERLRELNPGFDGKLEYEFDGKDVVKLSFSTTAIRDIAPLRALPRLRNLACGGAWPVFGQLSDLKPLEGMKLTSLDIHDTQVANLSPLKGMPLTDLACNGTKVADLSPLKDMPLKNLRIDSTRVTDLAPLTGMKLETLNCFFNQVTDLAPLKDMKLRFLDCNSQVTDAGLAPLQEMSSLRDLRIGGPKMTEAGLAHLKKLTDLESLHIIGVRLTEAGLANLKGMTKLEWLVLPSTALTDEALVHLKGFPRLRALSLVQTRVTDAGVEHLAGLKSLVVLDVTRTDVTDKGVARLKAALPTCKITWSGGVIEPTDGAAVGEKAAPLAAKTLLPTGLTDEEWPQRVKGLDFRKVPDAVAERLRELNPGFDGKVEFTKDGPEVVKVALSAAKVKDISPVQALPRLRSLDCSGLAWTRNGQLADLSPLRGMKLTSLWCIETQVADLAPLKDMPLTSLNCANTSISDLSPLKGMPLRDLNVYGTQVADLSPIHGMELETLNLSLTPVADLSPLKGMKLKWLNCNASRVTAAGLKPLQGMASLRHLEVGGPKMTEDALAILKDLPDLVSLYFLDSPLTEVGLKHIRGKGALQILVLTGTGLTDDLLVHLKDLRRLRVLSLQQSQVTDAGLEHLTGLTSLDELDVIRTAVTDKGIAKIKAALPACKIIWSGGVIEPTDGTAVGKKAAPLTAKTLLPTGLKDEEWLERVKGLDFRRVPDAVAERLRELNPGFDGKLEYEFDGKEVVKLSFSTTAVKDITPLRALPGLKNLACGGAWPVFGQITDLKPLKGMKLTSLYLRDTYVADLSPLKGMPLTNLVCTGTKVSDLSPLKGMPLKTLHIDSTPVTDLSPLRGMNLETLNCFATPVTDLAPLKDMNLTSLNLDGSQVTGAGLAPLQEMSSLRHVNIGGPKMTEDGLMHLKKLTDLESLFFLHSKLTEAGLRNIQGMTKLHDLVLVNTGLTDADLVHLKGFLGLRVLNLARTRVTDAGLEHLVGLTNLVTLDLASTAVTGKGVAKLKAALLQFLLLQDTGLTDEDLVELKGFFRLRALSLAQTRVTDAGLEHLTGLRHLVELYLNGTAVTDKGVAKLKAALPQCKIIR